MIKYYELINGTFIMTTEIQHYEIDSDHVQTLLTGLQDTVTGTESMSLTYAQRYLSTVLETNGATLSTFTGNEGMIESIKAGAKKAIEAIKNAFLAIWNKITSFFKDKKVEKVKEKAEYVKSEAKASDDIIAKDPELKKEQEEAAEQKEVLVAKKDGTTKRKAIYSGEHSIFDTALTQLEEAANKYNTYFKENTEFKGDQSMRRLQERILSRMAHIRSQIPYLFNKGGIHVFCDDLTFITQDSLSEYQRTATKTQQQNQEDIKDIEKLLNDKDLSDGYKEKLRASLDKAKSRVKVLTFEFNILVKEIDLFNEIYNKLHV